MGAYSALQKHSNERQWLVAVRVQSNLIVAERYGEVVARLFRDMKQKLEIYIQGTRPRCQTMLHTGIVAVHQENSKGKSTVYIRAE